MAHGQAWRSNAATPASLTACNCGARLAVLKEVDLRRHGEGISRGCPVPGAGWSSGSPGGRLFARRATLAETPSPLNSGWRRGMVGAAHRGPDRRQVTHQVRDLAEFDDLRRGQGWCAGVLGRRSIEFGVAQAGD